MTDKVARAAEAPETKEPDAREQGHILLVEGESDAQTAWLHGIPALGIPGAATWKPEWAAYLANLTVYVWKEPDEGGDAFAAKVGESLPNARILAAPEGRKDLSECHVLGDDVPALANELMGQSEAYGALLSQRLDEEAAQCRRAAGSLLETPSVLDAFAGLCDALGLVGETRNAKLLYLAVTSRLLPRVVSLAVKGPSSGGKSVLVETVLSAFPDSAYYALSGMSDRALAYSEEPLGHRMLVLFEAAGVNSDFGTYLLRTLLSEGKIRYETVEKTSEGLRPRLVEREGPTGLLLTTTWASLHPENETRLLSLTVRDDPEQTRSVLRAQAGRATGASVAQVDLAPWHALQRWLELAGCRDVVIPYAEALATAASASGSAIPRRASWPASTTTPPCTTWSSRPSARAWRPPLPTPSAPPSRRSATCRRARASPWRRLRGAWAWT